MGPVVVAAWPPLQPEQREGGAGPWRGEARRATSLSSAFHSFLPMPPNRMAALKKYLSNENGGYVPTILL